MKTRITLSRGGRITIPAAIRRRWQTSIVAFEDRGDRLVLRPAADDPIAAAEGALADEMSDASASLAFVARRGRPSAWLKGAEPTWDAVKLSRISV